MSSRHVMKLILMLILCGPSYARESKILLIAVDGLTCDWLSSYGSTNKTPNLDRLADSGLRFTTNWQSSHDKTQAEKYFWFGDYVNEGTTFVTKLKKAGYQTHYFGLKDENAYLSSFKEIQEAGFSHVYLNGGVIKNIHQDSNPVDRIREIMKKDEDAFVVLRITCDASGSKPDLEKSVVKLDEMIASIMNLGSSVEPMTIIFTALSGTKHHVEMSGHGQRKLQTSPSEKKKKFKSEKLTLRDIDIKLPLIVSSKLVPKQGLYTRDLVDSTSFARTILDLAEIKYQDHTYLKSFAPSIKGDLDPLKKRNWIFCDSGSDKMIRSWDYVYYTSEKIYGMEYDPLQKINLLAVKTNNKVFAGERLRLKMIYERDFLGIEPKIETYEKVEEVKP